MSSETWMASMTSEHDYRFARVLVGDAEELRARLAEAVERLGYQVLGEQPLMARRRARGAGRSGCSADILDYPTELIVTLKPLSATATHATFTYTVKNYYYGTRGDARTMESETDAIAALARAQGGPSACASCGAEDVGDSRFCRRCGAPLVSEEPAEVAVLRLGAGARAAYKNIMPGALVILFSLAVAGVLALVGKGKALDAARLLLAVGGLTGLFMLLAGMWRLHRALNSERAATTAHAPADDSLRALAAARTSALPPAPAQVSVTENTTELLDEAALAEPVALRRPKDDSAG